MGGGDPWFAVWEEQDFTGFDFALFAGLVHPQARSAVLDLLADWYVWSWYLDDLILERFKRSGDVVGARKFLAGLAAVLAPDAAPPRGNPVAGGLSDLWRRTTARRPAAWRERLGRGIPNLFEDAIWEVDNLSRGRVPEPVDYLQMRRQAGGAGWAAQLTELALGIALPADLVESSGMRRLHDAFADVVDLHNDLISYRREVEYEHDVSNAVVVVQHHAMCSPAEAAARTWRLLQARLELFEDLAAHGLSRLRGAREGDAGERKDVEHYVQALRDWLAGDFQWHLETSRYDAASWQGKAAAPHTPRGPQGLGTSAARLADTFTAAQRRSGHPMREGTTP